MHYSHTLLTTASPEIMWKVLTDVRNWKNWGVGLKDSLLKGPFGLNTEGVIVPDKGYKTSFRITSVKPNFSVTYTSKLPFAQIHLHGFLGYHNRKTTFTNEVWVEGPLGEFWWKLFGKRYVQFLQRMMAKEKQIAESA
ncbi:MAG: hypothetical protein SFU87_13980 [Chitinophagaceae bacterium]|nr:hypothetical protein [Chitinophagaceae bacterium]